MAAVFREFDAENCGVIAVPLKTKTYFLARAKTAYVYDMIRFGRKSTIVVSSADQRPDHLAGPTLKHVDPDLREATIRRWKKMSEMSEENLEFASLEICHRVSQVIETQFKSLLDDKGKVKIEVMLAVLQRLGTQYWAKDTEVTYSHTLYQQVLSHPCANATHTERSVADISATVKQTSNNMASRINIPAVTWGTGNDIIAQTADLLIETIVARKWEFEDPIGSIRFDPNRTVLTPTKRRAGTRLAMVAYRTTDLDLKPFGAIKKGKIEEVKKLVYERESKDLHRSVCSVTPGLQIEGFAAPRPDTKHSDSAREGLQKRLMGVTPVPTVDFYADLAVYSKLLFDHEEWGRKFMDNADFNTRVLTDFEYYLSLTNYSEKQKQTMRDARSIVVNKNDLEPDDFDKWCEVMCFVKEEAYDEPKYHRGIYARADYFKVIFGPFVKCIEKVVFSSPYFIKKIPVSERAEWLFQKLYEDGAKYAAGDFTGFEKHSIPKLMNSSVHVVYAEFEKYFEHMLSGSSGMLSVCAKVLRGLNQFVFKYFTASFAGGKCSGEMDTSVSNGVFNWITMMYVLEREGFHYGIGYFHSIRPYRKGAEMGGFLKFVAEGDDGVITFPLGIDLTGLSTNAEAVAFFARYGLDMTIEWSDDVGEAGFVSLYFNTTVRQLITSPFKHLGRMWVSSRYVCARETKLRSLMRMKAMCLLFQFPACPILASYCEMVLRLTSGYDVRHLYWTMDSYDRERFAFLLNPSVRCRAEAIHPLTRLTCSNLFGVHPDLQVQIENYFASVNEWSTILRPPGFECLTPFAWAQNWDTYVMELDVTVTNFESNVCILPLRKRLDAPMADNVHEALLPNHKVSVDQAYNGLNSLKYGY